MTHGRIAPDQDDLAGERMFAVQLTVTILCQNDLHLCLMVIRKDDFPIVSFHFSLVDSCSCQFV